MLHLFETNGLDRTFCHLLISAGILWDVLPANRPINSRQDGLSGGLESVFVALFLWITLTLTYIYLFFPSIWVLKPASFDSSHNSDLFSAELIGSSPVLSRLDGRCQLPVSGKTQSS